MSKEKEKWKGGNETLSRGEREPSTHSWLIYRVPPVWEMTRLPLTQLLAIQPTQGIYVMFVGLAIERPRLCLTPRPPDASHAISPRVLRFEASRHTRIPSPSCWAFGLGFEAQTKKPSSDGFVGKPPNLVCSARPPAKPLDSAATVHRLDHP
jgi:hypothetical protein